MKRFMTGMLSIFIVTIMGFPAWAHVTPNLKLLSTKESVSRLLPQGRLFLKNVDLTSDHVSRLKSQGNWHSNETHYKFFVVRDDNGKLVRTAVFVTEFTRHGPLVVAVGLDGEGKVVEALLTDIQTEPMEWVGPLLRRHYMRDFRGKDSSLPLTLTSKWTNGTSGLTQSYALFIANAVKRSAQLFDLVFK